jgi:hypothetical protein
VATVAIVLFIAIDVIVLFVNIYVVAHDVTFTLFVFLSQLFMGRVWLLNIIVINGIYLLLINYYYTFVLVSWRPTIQDISTEILILLIRMTHCTVPHIY